jgi:hypothetical protein
MRVARCGLRVTGCGQKGHREEFGIPISVICPLASEFCHLTSVFRLLASVI